MQEKIQAILDNKGPMVHAVSPWATVATAVVEMNAQRIGSLVVLEEDRLFGIFTERDVLVRVVAAHRDPATTPVGEVMTREVVTIRPDTLVEEAMQLISRRRCRHLPVLDGGRLVGLVSSGDLTQWLVRHHEAEISDLVGYVTQG